MARAASSLNHPNAVSVYEIGQAAGTWFIAAELIEGVTLREKRKQGKLPLASAIAIVAPCAAVLHTAHPAGIPADVHQPPSSHLPHQSSRVPMRERAPVMRPAGRTPNLLPTPIYEMIRG
jgi:hypothetical protein